MNHDTVRTRRGRRTPRALLLLSALAGGLLWMAAGPSGPTVQGQPVSPPPSPAPPSPAPPSSAPPAPPTERIDVEQAVSFPYDI